MSITLKLTADEADALYDVLNHTSRDIEERLPDCKDDPEEMEVWGPMYDAAMRVMELIEAETTQQIIEGGAMSIIKDIIVDALSCAADNALDMYVGSVDSQAYAVGIVTLEVLCGDGDERIDCGYFDTASFNAGLALEEDRLTRGECRPHLTQAINEFLKIEGGA